MIVTAAPPNARERATRRSRPLASRAFRPLRGAAPGASWPRCTTFSMAPPSTALPDVELVELARSGDRIGVRRAAAPARRAHAGAGLPPDGRSPSHGRCAPGGLPQGLQGPPAVPGRQRLRHVALPHHLQRVHRRAPQAQALPRLHGGSGRPRIRPPGAGADRQRVRDRPARPGRACPIDQRVTVVLVDGEGFDHREAAEILGVAPGTVASRLHRARAALRRCSGRRCDERASRSRPTPSCAPRSSGCRSRRTRTAFWTRLDEARSTPRAAPGPPGTTIASSSSYPRPRPTPAPRTGRGLGRSLIPRSRSCPRPCAARRTASCSPSPPPRRSVVLLAGITLSMTGTAPSRRPPTSWRGPTLGSLVDDAQTQDDAPTPMSAASEDASTDAVLALGRRPRRGRRRPARGRPWARRPRLTSARRTPSRRS